MRASMMKGFGDDEMMIMMMNSSKAKIYQYDSVVRYSFYNCVLIKHRYLKKDNNKKK